MTETNYRYKTGCNDVNLEDDDIYDHVLERDQYHKMSHNDPRCMRGAFGVKEYDMQEHFGNLSFSFSLWHIILILVVAYIIYYFYSRGDLF